MMSELPCIRQIPGEGRRRWFADAYFDLIVWFEGDGICGFQLCYDPAGRPRAYTWTRAGGTRHDAIDDGDAPTMKYKATPVLVADGPVDLAALERRFRRVSGGLPADIRKLVLGRMVEAQEKP